MKDLITPKQRIKNLFNIKERFVNKFYKQEVKENIVAMLIIVAWVMLLWTVAWFKL